MSAVSNVISLIIGVAVMHVVSDMYIIVDETPFWKCISMENSSQWRFQYHFFLNLWSISCMWPIFEWISLYFQLCFCIRHCVNLIFVLFIISISIVIKIQTTMKSLELRVLSSGLRYG